VTLGAVLFDLDGTLVDTAPDLVGALNRLLVAHGRVRMPYAIARNEASNGAAGLLRLGFGPVEPLELDELRRQFLEIYARGICVGSKLFIDMQIIRDLSLDVRWGIVTNKPDAFTRALLAALEIAALPGCVVSGDRLPQRKPDPAPLRLAAEELGVPAERCVYVGDAPRDIAAGKAAGMRTVAATYGYIAPREDVRAWGPDLIMRRPADLTATLARLRERWAA
jgi:phosphoglycolate phosphatase